MGNKLFDMDLPQGYEVPDGFDISFYVIPRQGGENMFKDPAANLVAIVLWYLNRVYASYNPHDIIDDLLKKYKYEYEEARRRSMRAVFEPDRPKVLRDLDDEFKSISAMLHSKAHVLNYKVIMRRMTEDEKSVAALGKITDEGVKNFTDYMFSDYKKIEKMRKDEKREALVRQNIIEQPWENIIVVVIATQIVSQVLRIIVNEVAKIWFDGALVMPLGVSIVVGVIMALIGRSILAERQDKIKKALYDRDFAYALTETEIVFRNRVMYHCMIALGEAQKRAI